MQCNSCGASIPLGAKHCPSCGTLVFPPGPFQESVSPPPPPASQPDRTMRASSYNAGPFQGMAPPPSSQPDNRTMAAGPYNFSPPPGSSPTAYGQPNYAPPPYYASGQQHEAVPQSPQFPPVQQQPPKRDRGLSPGMIILIIVLVLLMSGGFGLIYYTAVAHPAQLHTEATATAQTQQLREARATEQANTQATGTAVAYAHATATAQVQATAAAVATTTAQQNIYTSATSGIPALNEQLSGNTGSGWDTDLAQGGGGCAFTGGAYHASLYAKGFYFPCFAQNTNFSNFALQVQMTITRGDGGGLLFRGSTSANTFYIFRVESNGIYDLFKSVDSNHSVELSYGTSPAIKKYAGHTNLLTVIVRGNTIYLFANKQYIGSANDDTYKSGQVGVFAEDHTNPTDVAFNNVAVWRL